MKILVIEDEQQLLHNIKVSLEREQYLVETASDYTTALNKVLVYEYDCILLDIMLPNGSGLDILKELKKQNRTDNIIIISAKDSLDDKIKGLGLGADDYLTKPFHLAELNARINAILRRNNFKGSNEVQMANVKLLLDQHLFEVNHKPLDLNRKEYDILNYFFINKNRLITRTSLAEHVWGDNIDQADNLDFVYYQIKNLRKKLVDAGAEIEIDSIYGVGYKLIEK